MVFFHLRYDTLESLEYLQWLHIKTKHRFWSCTFNLRVKRSLISNRFQYVIAQVKENQFLIKFIIVIYE